MLVHSFFLGVIGHALHITFFLHLLHNLINIALDVRPHAPDLFQSFSDFPSLDLAYLSISLGFFIQKLKMLVSHVADIIEHIRIEVIDAFALHLVAHLHSLNGLSLGSVVLLQFSQRIQEGGQLLSFPEVRRPSLFGQFGRSRRHADPLHCESIAGQMGSTLPAIPVGLSLDFNLKLRVGFRVVDTCARREGDFALGNCLAGDERIMRKCSVILLGPAHHVLVVTGHAVFLVLESPCSNGSAVHLLLAFGLAHFASVVCVAGRPQFNSIHN